ncbi:MAG: VCBS repeat-containing protein [Phycisphaerales bacterium]|nr:MAG: VCBS repeat-containing protein [Phycisphaerales bacterium]
MPTRLRLFAILSFLFTGLSLSAGQVSYVESSSGLQTPGMEGGRTEFEFGDVNGDGHVDIASIGDHGSPYIGTSQHGIMVWFGDGTGNWSVYQNGNFGYGGIGLGDVNGDGLMDVGYGMHHDYSSTDFGDQLIEVALGDGTGQNWTPWDDGLATTGESWGMFGVDFADVDNDGDLDLGSAAFGCCSGLRVYLNQGDGTWAASFVVSGGNSGDDFVFGDVNGDGIPDFAAAHDAGTVYFGDGAGDFSLADGDLPGSSWRNGIALGDVNGDGRDDLSFENDNGGLEVWTWVADGDWQDQSGSLPASGEFRATQIADMDLDGHGDLVAFAADDYGLIVVYGGDGAGNWQQLATATTVDNCGYAAFRAGVDADHNGFPDMVLVSEEDCDWWTGGTNTARFFKEASTPSETWIVPKYPRGGEVLVAGSVRFIDWHAAVVASGRPSMTIELSQNGPEGPWDPVATSVPNNGRYQWLVPEDLWTSSNCYLRFTLDGAEAQTAGPFTISNGQLFGDFNGDGVLDLGDYEGFATCLNGPGASTSEECLSAFDSENDEDVDVIDFMQFQLVFTVTP